MYVHADIDFMKFSIFRRVTEATPCNPKPSYVNSKTQIRHLNPRLPREKMHPNTSLALPRRGAAEAGSILHNSHIEYGNYTQY